MSVLIISLQELKVNIQEVKTVKELNEISAAFLTLGCKVNQYETDSMTEILKSHGTKIADFNDKADIYIVNTCSVTNIADRKSRQMLHKARKKNPDAVIEAVGCYAQAAGRQLENDDAVDLIISNNRKKNIADILYAYINRMDTSDSFIDISQEKCFEEMKLSHISSHTRAYIKIQDGCNQFCSYCIIPYVRGRIRSREPEDIIEEITRLSADGIKEVVLTGIHISSYGMDKENGVNLLELIKHISKIKSIERIRLGSLEPGIITEEFVSAISSMEKICPHFHLSLQSGCDTVLKRMNRRYTSQDYLEKCELIRTYYDRPAITTDVIVGFPGETDEEFQQTCDFLERINFYEMHIFKYSPRKGTVAAGMPGQISPEIKEQRSHILLQMSERHMMAYNRLFDNEPVNVLVEEVVTDDTGTYLRGHTERYHDVFIYADDISRPADFINTMVVASGTMPYLHT